MNQWRLGSGPRSASTAPRVRHVSDERIADQETSWPGRGRVWRRGWIFGAVWLVFLWSPVSQAWRYPQPGWRAIALVALAGYSVLFLTAIWRQREWRMAGELARHRLAAWCIVAGELVLNAAMLPACGESALACLVFTSVSAMFVLPTLGAWLVVLAAALLPFAVSRLVPGWSDGRTIAVGVIGAGVAMYGFLQLIDRNRQLAEARQDLLEVTQARERERLGRDVHDVIGHSLTVVTLKAELAGRLLEAADGGTPEHLADGRTALADARTQLAEIEELSRSALADVRAIVAGYRQVSLGAELAAARAALRDAGIDADVPAGAEGVPAGCGELFGYLVREGVTNVIRHSGARHCAIEFEPAGAAVLDDGRGLPEPVPSEGSGLAGLAARAREAGGRLSCRTVPGTRGGWGPSETRIAIEFGPADGAPSPERKAAAGHG